MSHFIGPALPPHLKEGEDSHTNEAVSTQIARPSTSGRRKSSSASSRADTEDESGAVLILSADMSDELFQDEDEEETYGPALPPGFKKTGESRRKPRVEVSRTSPDSTRVGSGDSSNSDSDADSSQARNSFGPALPSRLKSAVHSVQSSTEDDTSEKYIGPSLPPGFSRQPSSEAEEVASTGGPYGPTLPPEAQNEGEVSSSDAGDNNNNEGRYMGPALPPGFRIITDDSFMDLSAVPDSSRADSDSDDEAVGPQLITNTSSEAQRQLELRARMLRHEMATKDGAVAVEQKRESWMLELPAEKAAVIGLGPRQFRKREAEDLGDRSVWTDTPADRMKKKMDRKQPEESKDTLSAQASRDRDKAMDKLAEKHSGKRGVQSLLEMHQDKLKKKKKKDKKEGKSEERRPFSRELDLQTNRFDEAQKKSIFKKAQLLNDRFSAGHSKYL